MNFNPYQAPTSAYDSGFSSNYGNPGVVSDRTVAALRKTRPWVMFIAVVIFVFNGFMVLGALALMSTSEVGLGVGYLFAAALYVLPAVGLIRYSNSINKLLHGGGTAELDKAMDAQASFWQIAGIYTLIGTVFMVLALVIGIVAGAAFFNSF